MWVCHITETPGCSTALCSVPLHCTQARYFARTAEVTICLISERLPDRPQQLPLHSLTAEAEGGYLCCSRTSAMPSSPSQRTSRTTWCNGLPTTPTAAYLAAGGQQTCQPRQLQGQGGREKKKGSGVLRWDTCETTFCLPESTKVTLFPWHTAPLQPQLRVTGP